MKKLLRIIIGIILIAIGLLIGLFSISLWPQPFEWGGVLFIVTPVIVFGVAFVAIGWAVLAGISRKEAFELIMELWR